jgi:Trypsin-co-occurring domain 1
MDDLAEGTEAGGQVLVQVVVEEGREIGWGSNLAERLDERLDDIRRAMVSGARAVSASLDGLPKTEGWKLGEVSASFGVTLTAEAGVVLSKASAGATFDVTLTYRKET